MSIDYRRGSHNQERETCTFKCVICKATLFLRICTHILKRLMALRAFRFRQRERYRWIGCWSNEEINKITIEEWIAHIAEVLESSRVIAKILLCFIVSSLIYRTSDILTTSKDGYMINNGVTRGCKRLFQNKLFSLHRFCDRFCTYSW